MDLVRFVENCSWNSQLRSEVTTLPAVAIVMI